jgi:hypothetical protein
MNRSTVMNDAKRRERVIEYVRQCQCPSGGYCFYGIDEPNGSDTYFALSILHLLGVHFKDEKTLNYLHNLQHADGSYGSIFAAYYAVNGLRILTEEPRHDYSAYILGNIDQYKFNARQLPAEMTMAFKRTFYLINLYKKLKYVDHNKISNDVILFILRFAHADDKGFRIGKSSLRETAWALSILKQIEYPVERLKTENFLRACETRICGFTDVPRTSLSFMEHIHAGLLASSIIGHKPTFTEQCMDFIINCQNRTGGFSRTTHGGIATLENTFLAIESLMFLHYS